MTALLASLAAALFGVADFFGGVASRSEAAVRVSAAAQVTGVPIIAAALAFSPWAGQPSWTPVLIGGLAGIAGGVGVIALYASLARGRMSVVAPITAALAGSLPAVFELLRGVAIPPTSLAAITLAVVAIIIVSRSPGDDSEAADMRAAITLAVIAGVGFAGGYIALSFTDPASGLWPLAGSRTASTMLVILLAFTQTGGVVLRRPALRLAVAAGALDSVANIALLTAIQRGPLSVASVLASLYPVATLLLAHFVLGERMTPMQRFGIALAFSAVILASVG
jgi:drug/metabolite transporter (DMT)-like permease